MPAENRILATDAEFVDIIHTNSGNIWDGAVSLPEPLGNMGSHKMSIATIFGHKNSKQKKVINFDSFQFKFKIQWVFDIDSYLEFYRWTNAGRIFLAFVGLLHVM